MCGSSIPNATSQDKFGSTGEK
ncbi:hypothetical protein A2U01_0034570, partial [Trifolium medium]|nr:hypothetical protein [Trifolium medium]